MNKVFSTLCVAALSALAANAQTVLGYSVAQSSGTYTPLTGATVVCDANSSVSELSATIFAPDGPQTTNGSKTGYATASPINIAGQQYSNFLISGAGYVYFGNGEISFNTRMQANFLTYSGDYILSGFACNYGLSFIKDDVNAIYTKISYKAEASKLTVQYENVGLNYNFWEEYAPVDIQLIFTADGKVDIVLNDFASLGENDSRLFFGIRSGENYAAAGGELGALTTMRNNREQITVGSSLANGTTITLNTPTKCVVPASQPTDLNLTCTSNQVDGSFTPCEGADTYLVLYTTDPSKTPAPVNGTIYAKDDVLDGATVAYFGSDTEFILYDMASGTDFTYFVFATNAYGLDGPVYNTTSPLTATAATLPAPVKKVTFTGATSNSLSLSIESNDADDDVVVVYTNYCERDMYGDHGLIGTLAPDAKTGDVLPAPADFTPPYEIEGAPMPENSGIVAYAGKAGDLTISDLQPSTMYYVAVYTRNSQGKYTSLPENTGWTTVIEDPYTGNSYNFPRYSLPFGWTGSEDGESTYSFVDNEYWDSYEQAMRRGTQPIQQTARISRGDAVNGKEAWMVLPLMDINERHLILQADYSIVAKPSRFESGPYNEWAEGDQLMLQVSDDNGATWTTVAEYTPANNPKQEDELSYVSIKADLNSFRGKTVQARFYWKTFTTAGFGTDMFVDRISLIQGDFPAVPEVTVSQITDNSAVASWTSKQNDYEVVFNKKGDSLFHVAEVKGASTYTLENLDTNTEYEVKVRGINTDETTGEQTGYSEWSDPVTFTTLDYPEIPAPTNLTADTETLQSSGYVILNWDAAPEALRYEVDYRLASETTWTTVESATTSVILTTLEEDAAYIAKVRAFCTHDRTTAYSAQLRFQTPKSSGIEALDTSSAATIKSGQGWIAIEGAQGQKVEIFTTTGQRVAATPSASAAERYDLRKGVYIVRIGMRATKVSVR